jgi:predicted nucleotidyltransferase
VARGAESAGSDIDVLVLGEIGFASLVKALFPLHDALGREINPVLYTPREFAERAGRGESFAVELLQKPKLWIKGGADDLAELVGHPPAPGAHA